MIKYIIVLGMTLITLSASSQKKKRKEISQDCYLEQAVKIFNLSDESKLKLSTILIKKLKKRNAIIKEVRAFEIPKEEGKKKMRVVNKKYFRRFSELAAKPEEEIINFEKEVKFKCNG